MYRYNAKTAKRQYALANSPAIRSLDKGKLQVHGKKLAKEKIITARKYQDRSGKWRYMGTPELRKTE